MAYLAFKSDILTKAGQQARKDDKNHLLSVTGTILWRLLSQTDVKI